MLIRHEITVEISLKWSSLLSKLQASLAILLTRLGGKPYALGDACGKPRI